MKRIFLLLLLAGCSNKEPGFVTIGGIEMKTIPGLTAGDICKFYENKGYKTQSTTRPDLYEWTSIKALGASDRIVVTSGKTFSEIISIDSYFKNYTSIDAADSAAIFLSEAAFLPYSSYKPRVAEKWIKEHIRTGGDTTIGFVTLKLILVGESAGTLKMSVGLWR